MEITMKHPLLLALLIAIGPATLAARSQNLTPPPKPNPDQQQATEQATGQADQDPKEAAMQRDRQARDAQRAVRRAAQANPAQDQGWYAPMLVKPAGRPRTEKAAYLGISTSPPPAALRHQLKLPEGTGLVIDFVQPKGPAQEAGIRQYDLLVRLDDQLLVNAEQLAVLVRTFKPGAEIHLTLMREGERQTVPVTLAEREVPMLSDLEGHFRPSSPYAESLPGAPTPAPQPPRGFGGGTMGGGGGSGIAPMVGPGEHTLTWLDGKRQITVSVAGDQKTVTVADAKTGKIMFRGPLDAMQNQESLPPETREALSRLKQFLEASSGKQDIPAGQPKR
jgi:hypothetical protein